MYNESVWYRLRVADRTSMVYSDEVRFVSKTCTKIEKITCNKCKTGSNLRVEDLSKLQLRQGVIQEFYLETRSTITFEMRNQSLI